MKKLLTLLPLSVVLFASLLSSCVSNHTTDAAVATAVVTEDIATPKEEKNIVFPDPKRSYLHEWPRYEVTDVVKAGYGVNDDTIRAALGNPHFNEFDSNQWNYLVALRQPYTTNYVECQLQLHYDKDGLVEGIFWDSDVCPNIINDAIKRPAPVVERIIERVEVQAPAPVVAPVVETRMFTLASDILFEFDSSVLKASGDYELRKLVTQVNNEYASIERVNIIGYTDRFGEDSYNQKLGLHRATTVADALVNMRFNPALITVESRGENQPVTDGCYGMSDAQAKACLAPDRRVEVAITGGLK